MSEQAEGEARRYFEHAIAQLNTVSFLRHNPRLAGGEEGQGLGINLMRCESMILPLLLLILLSLPLSLLLILLNRAHQCVVQLWLYSKLHSGPPSLLLTKDNLTETPTGHAEDEQALSLLVSECDSVMHITQCIVPSFPLSLPLAFLYLHSLSLPPSV